MIQTEKLKKQREARLAAEALFEPIAQPPQTATATVVTVRHRRASPNSQEHVAAASSDAPIEAAARPPRTHLVVEESTAATTDSAAETAPNVIPLDAALQEARSSDVQPVEAPAVNAEAALTVGEPVAAPAADPITGPTLPKPRKTRRTAPTTVAVEPQPVERRLVKRVVNASRRSAQKRQDQGTRARQDHAPSVQQLPTTSGFDAYDWPVYPKLVAQIEDLKRQAQVIRERESAEAVEWIKEAIQQYGLSAQDLGFGRGRR